MEAPFSYSFEWVRTGGRRKKQRSSLIQSPGVPSPAVGYVGQDTGTVACTPPSELLGDELRGTLKSRDFDMNFIRDRISIQGCRERPDTQIGTSISVSVGGKGKSSQLSADLTQRRVAHWRQPFSVLMDIFFPGQTSGFYFSFNIKRY